MNEGQTLNEGGVMPAFAAPGERAFPIPPAVAGKASDAGTMGRHCLFVLGSGLFQHIDRGLLRLHGEGQPARRHGRPDPREVLSLGLVCVTTVCLLSSSATVHFAEKALLSNNRSRFIGLWLSTIVLGDHILVRDSD